MQNRKRARSNLSRQNSGSVRTAARRRASCGGVEAVRESVADTEQAYAAAIVNGLHRSPCFAVRRCQPGLHAGAVEHVGVDHVDLEVFERTRE